MPLAFRTKKITINRSSGTVTIDDDLDFDSEVLKANVAIKGSSSTSSLPEESFRSTPWKSR